MGGNLTETISLNVPRTTFRFVYVQFIELKAFERVNKERKARRMGEENTSKNQDIIFNRKMEFIHQRRLVVGRHQRNMTRNTVSVLQKEEKEAYWKK